MYCKVLNSPAMPSAFSDAGLQGTGRLEKIGNHNDFLKSRFVTIFNAKLSSNKFIRNFSNS